MLDALSLLPGVLFHGRYRVVRCIKRGGMGAVFEILDERTDTRRALKVMHPDAIDDADLRGRFEREVRVTGAIESDHVVRVSDGGVDAASGTPFLVMELLRGSDLGALLHDAGRIAPADTVRYLGQAALGIERAHAAGIVHRDLKPENLFLTRRDDGSPCVKVLDFGIAKIVAHRTRATDTRTMGTPTYMAPEQIRGEGTIGPPADVYALGLIAYALLVGQDYWSEEARSAGSMFSFFSRVVQGMPEAPAARAARTHGVALGEAFDAWLRRATALRPADRFAGAGAAVAALADALGVETPPGLSLQPDPTRRDHDPGPAGATTQTTAVVPSQVITTGGTPTALDRSEVLGTTGGAFDTVPMSVWSQTATSVSPAAPHAEAAPVPEVSNPTPLSSAAPIPIRRPVPRRVLGFGSLGAVGVAGAIAWGLLGTRASLPPGPAPEPHAGAGAAQAGDPTSAPPSITPAPAPSGDAGALPGAATGAKVEAPAARSSAARLRPQAPTASTGKPGPSASARSGEPGLPGLL